MEKVNLKIKGNILVTSNKNGIIYNNHNTIAEDALEVLINCLYQGNSPKQIDTVVVYGDDIGEYERNIVSAIYDPAESSITFKVIFYESDFDGTINSMELKSSSYNGRIFATKTGVELLKDSESRIQIEWKIQIGLC